MLRSLSRFSVFVILPIAAACGGGGSTLPATSDSVIHARSLIPSNMRAHNAHVVIREFPLPWASAGPGAVAQATDGSVYLAVIPTASTPASGAVRFQKGQFTALALPTPPPISVSNLPWFGHLVASVTGPVYGQNETVNNASPEQNTFNIVGYRATSLIGTQNSVGNAAGNYAEITTDSSGGVWWDNCGGQVAGVSTFPSPYEDIKQTTVPDNLQAITYGPAGALWVAGLSSQIYELSTAPALLRSFAFPYGFISVMAPGADGNLWIVGLDGSIVRMSTTGSFARFTLPNGGTAVDITSGPNNLMWFTDSVNNAVGSISASGQIEEYSVPSAHAGLGAIAGSVSRKRALARTVWFAEANVDKLAELTVR